MSVDGSRYPLVGGTRGRHFDGTNSKPHKLPENAQTPTTMAPAWFAGDRVHAVLGAHFGTPTNLPDEEQESHFDKFSPTILTFRAEAYLLYIH
jgi:hypothetical protein